MRRHHAAIGPAGQRPHIAGQRPQFAAQGLTLSPHNFSVCGAAFRMRRALPDLREGDAELLAETLQHRALLSRQDQD